MDAPGPTSRRRRALLLSSGGGHWVQMLRLRPAFEGCDVSYACVRRDYRADVPGAPFHVVNDATRWNKAALGLQALRVLYVLARVRPDVVVSTGAAPGYFALRFGRALGARTVWLDSIANVDELSMTGRLVRRWSDLWLTQWPHLATEGGPRYAGAVFSCEEPPPSSGPARPDPHGRGASPDGGGSPDAARNGRPAAPPRGRGILVTVGAQMAFDRLVGAVDAWAARNPQAEVFAQIGPTDAEPRHVRWTRFLAPEEFRRRVADAEAVVAHAGMGTILTALELGKPIVVLPRRGDLRETRNDHQVATAERLSGLGLVRVAREASDVGAWLDRVPGLSAAAGISRWASPSLLGALREFVGRG